MNIRQSIGKIICAILRRHDWHYVNADCVYVVPPNEVLIKQVCFCGAERFGPTIVANHAHVHEFGQKFRRASEWHRACVKCGHVEAAAAPKTRKKHAEVQS